MSEWQDPHGHVVPRIVSNGYCRKCEKYEPIHEVDHGEVGKRPKPAASRAAPVGVQRFESAPRHSLSSSPKGGNKSDTKGTDRIIDCEEPAVTSDKKSEGSSPLGGNADGVSRCGYRYNDGGVCTAEEARHMYFMYESWEPHRFGERGGDTMVAMLEYREIAEGTHDMQVANGWCECFKGGTKEHCDMWKKLKELNPEYD